MEKKTTSAKSAQDASVSCDYKNGLQSGCAPLASTFVPFQQEEAPKYGSDEALTRGTLFPGLDLPWMNKVNKDNPYAGTPTGELMAIDFVIRELNLYLDTHADDAEAFGMLQQFMAMSKEATAKYVELYGPVTLADMTTKYTWLNDPWPWEFMERNGK